MSLRDKLSTIGFTEDYVIPFNVRRNAPGVLQWLDFQNDPLDHKDLIWLCNQIASIGRRKPYTLEHRDNFRICRLDSTKVASESYRRAENDGCCGFFDEVFTNPETGRSYLIGFNFGH